MPPIFKILTIEEWRAFERDGVFKGSADDNSYASRGPFARYCVGSIKCSYGVPGNMTYG